MSKLVKYCKYTYMHNTCRIYKYLSKTEVREGRGEGDEGEERDEGEPVKGLKIGMFVICAALVESRSFLFMESDILYPPLRQFVRLD